ncbi:MAG: hypothetical protein CM1200mP30_12590 [Pseudomonadota bacterium]|nr:MAG: hypothetical protein CM1200mP30_12590 [Pseudomonadota bacterium]
MHKKFLEKLPVLIFTFFPFSARKGTTAFSIEDQVLPTVKQKRGEELRKLSIQKRYDFHKQFLGKIEKYFGNHLILKEISAVTQTIISG